MGCGWYSCPFTLLVRTETGLYQIRYPFSFPVWKGFIQWEAYLNPEIFYFSFSHVTCNGESQTHSQSPFKIQIGLSRSGVTEHVFLPCVVLSVGCKVLSTERGPESRGVLGSSWRPSVVPKEWHGVARWREAVGSWTVTKFEPWPRRKGLLLGLGSSEESETSHLLTTHPERFRSLRRDVGSLPVLVWGRGNVCV